MLLKNRFTSSVNIMTIIIEQCWSKFILDMLKRFKY